MIGILLVAHVPLARAFLEVATHVYRQTPENVQVLDVLPDQEPAEVERLIIEISAEINTGDGVLILTDVSGATPSNCALRVISEHVDFALIHGLNVPMLLRALNYRTLPLSQMTQKALEGGKNGTYIFEDQAKLTHAGA